jgi:hypothetical protein
MIRIRLRDDQASESLDLPVALPELDGAAVDQLARIFPCGVVIGADKLQRPQHTTVVIHQTRQIFRHPFAPQRSRW